ncbi:unnamed protein product, partial [Mesorhabditis belari]|uniref:Uncharacterized protein n=1 Tax=Mesorhabditis belari TaxID=2138241 RepID=A0AAF3FJZ1_9BILA
MTEKLEGDLALVVNVEPLELAIIQSSAETSKWLLADEKLKPQAKEIKESQAEEPPRTSPIQPNLLIPEEGFKFSSKFQPWKLHQERSYGPASTNDKKEGYMLAVYLGVYDDAHFFYNEQRVYAIIPLESFNYETYRVSMKDLIPGRKCMVETQIHKRQNSPNKNSFVERKVVSPIRLLDDYYKAVVMKSKQGENFILMEVKLGPYVNVNTIKNKAIAIHEEVIEGKNLYSKKIHQKVHDWHDFHTKKKLDHEEDFIAYIYLERNPANSLVPLWMIAHICGGTKKKKKVVKTEVQESLSIGDKFLEQNGPSSSCAFQDSSPTVEAKRFNLKDVQQRQESTGQGFEGNRQREIPVQDYRACGVSTGDHWNEVHGYLRNLPNHQDYWGDEEQDRDHYMSAHDRHLSRSDSPYQDQYHARRDSLNQLGFASPRRSPIEVYEPPPQYEELMRSPTSMNRGQRNQFAFPDQSRIESAYCSSTHSSSQIASSAPTLSAFCPHEIGSKEWMSALCRDWTMNPKVMAVLMQEKSPSFMEI